MLSSAYFSHSWDLDTEFNNLIVHQSGELEDLLVEHNIIPKVLPEEDPVPAPSS
jgi:hypothetical protein